MKVISLYEPRNNAQLAAQFINSTQQHIFLTGRAGTGKTTFLRSIVKDTYKNVIVVAPTGIAAINAGGVTIHSMFQIPPGGYLPTYDRSLTEGGKFHNAHSLIRQQRLSKEKQKVIRELELLIIDEVSMLRADLLDAIDTVMRSVRRAHNRPFGGVQVLFIGDLLQLPPVIKDEEWMVLRKFYRSAFFFDAVVLQEAPPLYIELDKIYRQSDTTFISLLNNLRNNTVTKQDEELLNQYYKPGYYAIPQDNYIQLTTHNQKADTINKDALRKLKSKTVVCKAEIEDDFPVTMYPADVELELKVDAQIMFIKNDGIEKRYFNGKIGKVISVEPKKLVVQFPGEDKTVCVEKHTWENIKYTVNPSGMVESDVIGTFTQFPVKLAWAITVHKSQGLTFTKAIIDIEQAFAPGQVYVALSRLTSLDGLILSSKVNFRSLRLDQTVSDYSLSKPSDQTLSNLLETEGKAYVENYVVRCFDMQPLEDTFVRYIDEQPTDEERSLRAVHQQWARKIVNDFQETRITASRFVAQVRKLGSDWPALQARVTAAQKYFGPVLHALRKTIVAHIEKVSEIKRAKQYLAGVTELKLAVEKHIALMDKAGVMLKASIEKTQLTKKELYVAEPFPAYRRREERSEYYDADQLTENDEPKGKKSRNPKKQKGDSINVTFEYHQKGMSIPDIAMKRKMTVGTITSHIVECIADGRCRPEDFIEDLRLANIRMAAEQLGTYQLGPLREHLGEDYSFDELRMAVVREQRAVKMAT